MLVDIIATIATSPPADIPQEWAGWVSLVTSGSTFGLLVWLITVGQPKEKAEANANALAMAKEFREAVKENREELGDMFEKVEAGAERNRQMFERHLEKFAAVLLEMRAAGVANRANP